MGELPPGLASLIRSLFLPTDGQLVVPTSGTNLIELKCYLNHSPRPNMRSRDGATFTTLRQIGTGEELTVDYRSYGAKSILPARSLRSAKGRTRSRCNVNSRRDLKGLSG